MQLIFKSRGNALFAKPFTIEAFREDTVITIKQKVTEKLRNLDGAEELLPSQQCFVFNEVQMDDGQQLTHYGIEHEATIYLEKLKMLINVKTNSVDAITHQVPIRDLEGEISVGFLKEKIYELTNIKKEDQCLVFAGNQLEDDRSLSSYNIEDGDTIDILSKIQIFVKNLNDRTYTFDVTPADSVAHLREMIQEKEGTPADNQRLVFAGKQLEEGKLLNYNIQRGSTIFIVERLLGGLHF